MIEQENIPYTADEIKAMVKTIEELRNKYNKALERARALNDEKDVDIEAGTTICEYIFPELKEDTNDERIRKEIVDFITSSNKYGTNERCEAWLNWLEKQSEKDPCIGCTNDKGCITCKNGNLKEIKIESKFREGDWIANGGANPCYVKSIFGDYYELCSCEGFEYTKPIIDVNYTYHFWTIQDAKDGDVLACESGWACIFKALDEHINTFSSYCFMDKDKWFCETGSKCHTLNKEFMKAYNGEIKPATKEQRDLLFQKMKEAGYEWDTEKKELKTIELKKIEPKFKVRDWITDGYIYCKITEILDDRYIIESKYDKRSAILFEYENRYHPWTINDANDGDVLASGDVIFIFNNIHGVWVRCHCSLRKDGSFKDRNYDLMYAKDSKEVYPATKEQRDLLFEKMKEAGWEWDVKKKELSKQPLKSTPKFCIGQLITDDNGTWYKITKIKCLDDWYYELYDACEDTTHLELCSIIDEKFRENRFVGEIKKMMGD